MSSTPVPIIYCHIGGFPGYLYRVIESARFFNPQSPIYLISDQSGLDLDTLRVEVVSTESLHSPIHAQFVEHYVHLSSVKPTFARFCIERWFFVGEMVRRIGSGRAAHLDSDGMLFHDVGVSFPFVSTDPYFLCSKIVGPALTFINKPIDPYLEMIVSRYRDKAFLESYRARNLEAETKGSMVNLDDMEFLVAFAKESKGGLAPYRNNLPIGHIDHCIYGNPDGLRSVPNRRHLNRKCIYWEDVDGAFRPSFRRADDDSKVPTLLIHFQNGAKRRIRRFNRVGRDSLLPRALRLAYYNFALN